MTGTVTAVDDGDGRRSTVRGANDLGDHVTGTVDGGAAVSDASTSAARPPIVGIGATEFSKARAAASCSWPCEAVEAALDDAGHRAVRRRRHGHLHHGHQPRDRGRPQPRHRRAEVLQPHPLRRRRGVRHDPAGRDGRRHRRGRRRGLLPRLQRALGPPLRHRRAGPAAERQRRERALRRGTRRTGCVTPAQWVAMFARRYMHEYGATSEDFGRVAVADRKHAATNPAAWFYEQPITLEDHQAVALDRRAAAPARLLPGERRRPGARRHQRRAGPRPAAAAGGHRRAPRRARATTSR